MPECKCIICGTTFQSKRNAMICNSCRKRTCVVCGKEFEIDPSQLNKTTCSRKCKSQLAKDIKAGSAKGIKKICEYCGKEFYTNHNRRRYCYDDHYATCEVCGKQFKILHMDSIPSTCSEECKHAKIKNTCKDRYGVDYVFQSEEFKQNAIKTNLSKYGVDNVSKSDEIKKKIQNTFQEKYGCHPMQREDIRLKAQNTMEALYGFPHSLQSQESKSKMYATMQSKYGVTHALNSPKFIDKMKDTNMRNFGVPYPAMSEQVQNKIKTTSMDRYNVENGKYLEMTDFSKYDIYMKFKSDPRAFIIDLDYSPSIHKLCDICGVLDSAIGRIIHEYHVEDLIDWKTYSLEEEVKEVILDIDPTCNIIMHDRKIIYPNELDLYLPDYNLAIECNPTETHNSSFHDPWGGPPKHPKYHQQKSNECLKKGVQLLHIFSYEWKYKRNILESIIRNNLKKPKNRIYARNTHVITDISYNECKLFLDTNHRQGNCMSKVRIGLATDDGQLVSVMTFGKLRTGISKTLDSENDDWEILRFCSLLNTSVIGGASKLFKYFIKNYKYRKIVSFSDVAHTSGGVYEILGFKFIRQSDPGYMWVNLKDDSYLTRVQCQKQNIVNILPNVDTSMTEQQIMMLNGYGRVYDSGADRWEFMSK